MGQGGTIIRVLLACQSLSCFEALGVFQVLPTVSTNLQEYVPGLTPEGQEHIRRKSSFQKGFKVPRTRILGGPPPNICVSRAHLYQLG